MHVTSSYFLCFIMNNNQKKQWYKLTVSYDGTMYSGWQIQPDRPTIASEMEQVYLRVFGYKIKLRGVSRTDAGVHAKGHVSFFYAPVVCTPDLLKYAWNNSLPSDICIKEVALSQKIIHPHALVDKKMYQYTFFQERPSPFVAKYGWYVVKKINNEKLKQVLSLFVGSHDFRFFCSADITGNTVKKIDNVDLVYNEELKALSIVFEGKGFLRYMIRRLVGVAVQYATGDKISLYDIKKMLAGSCDKAESYGFTAPAKGLSLCFIKFKEFKNE